VWTYFGVNGVVVAVDIGRGLCAAAAAQIDAARRDPGSWVEVVQRPPFHAVDGGPLRLSEMSRRDRRDYLQLRRLERRR
ncbi:MAG: hypothetical protein NZ518_12630, partial [Dehalococcoidia bacterium]|nr:hypothetical protein [Dehalococcoidia bacterium]